ncbi:MAG TPA: acylphosphatase [Nitrospirales bacterium]|nr:acylphosphatase [Nitrospirales bacterium]
MSESSRAHVFVQGRVQGVGYRAFARSAALRLGLTGGVRNLPDARVEVEAEGPKGRLEQFLEQLKSGPVGARVSSINVTWDAPTGSHAGFEIWY